MKIVSFELENVKRVALVRLAPSEKGLTVIGGDNAQGKTSVLDGIIYALGGERYRPGNLQREGSMAEARIRIELTGGLIVERKGKNASLKVTDPSGKRSGQKLLDDFVEELALNLPKFLAMRDDEKAEVLLNTLGIEKELKALDLREQKAYDDRHAFGVIVDQKKKYAKEMQEYHDVPEDMLSAADMIKASQEILKRNSERDRLRNNLSSLKQKQGALGEKVASLRAALAEAEAEALKVSEEVVKAMSNPIPENESTAELEGKIVSIDETNAKIRANQDKQKALLDAENCDQKLNELSDALEKVRAERRKLLDGANLPLPELTIDKNDKGRPILLYKGMKWDCMSTMEKYRVAVAIVQKLKPECGFVLLDGMEAFDMEQLKEFDTWLESVNLQAIATRVSKGEECSIIIEDGVAVDPNVEPAPEVPSQNDPIPETQPETHPTKLEEW